MGSTRDAVLDAALDLLMEEGAPSEVRLEDIARRAGVSRQSVYLHFGSRAGLLVALVQHVDTEGMLESLVQQVFDAPTALDAVDAIAHLHAEYSPVVYPVARVFMAGRRDDAALRVAWDDRMEARRNVYRVVVERLLQDSLLGAQWEVAAATDIVFAVTSWEVWELLVIDRGWSKEAYRGQVAATLRRTLVDQTDHLGGSRVSTNSVRTTPQAHGRPESPR